MLFGGRVSYSAVQPPRLAESMRRRMVRIFPQTADLKVEYTWGGYLDITMSRAPDFGRLAPNVFYLQGFSGHGMALTGLAGKLVAEAVAGTAERFDVFARLPHRDFPGGPTVPATLAGAGDALLPAAGYALGGACLEAHHEAAMDVRIALEVLGDGLRR